MKNAISKPPNKTATLFMTKIQEFRISLGYPLPSLLQKSKLVQHIPPDLVQECQQIELPEQ